MKLKKIAIGSAVILLFSLSYTFAGCWTYSEPCQKDCDYYGNERRGSGGEYSSSTEGVKADPGSGGQWFTPSATQKCVKPGDTTCIKGNSSTCPDEPIG